MRHKTIIDCTFWKPWKTQENLYWVLIELRLNYDAFSFGFTGIFVWVFSELQILLQVSQKYFRENALSAHSTFITVHKQDFKFKN